MPKFLAHETDILRSVFGNYPYVNKKIASLETLTHQEPLPKWPLYLQIATTVITFGISAFYHTHGCQSLDTMLVLRRLDLTGISIGIMGGSTPPFYYGFYCDQMRFYQVLWIGLVWCCCLVALAVTIKPSILAQFEKNWVIAGIYIVAGYSTSPGYLHMWLVIDPAYLPVVPVWTFVVAGLCAAIGGVIYSLKVPERYYPLKFDYFGNSHNIFHTLSVVGFLLAMRGSIRMYHER